MCLLALSCSKNHLFVLPSGGGRSSVYGTDPHFDSASGALPWWRSRTHSGGRSVGVSPSAWFVSLLGRFVPFHAASKDVAAPAARTWPHQGVHSGRGGRQCPLGHLGHSAHQVDFCDPASTVVQPRQDVDNEGDRRAEHACTWATRFARVSSPTEFAESPWTTRKRVRRCALAGQVPSTSANVVAEPAAIIRAASSTNWHPQRSELSRLMRAESIKGGGQSPRHRRESNSFTCAGTVQG